jgi:hypothetical protein
VNERGQSLRRIKLKESGPPASVIVVADEGYGSQNTILNLGSVHYPIRVIVVCRQPENHGSIAALLYKYKGTLPSYSVFKPESELSIPDAMNAGLQFVNTPYFCVLRHDMIHMLTFEYAIAEMHRTGCACLHVKKYFTNRSAWSSVSEMRKPVWSTTAVMRQGGFKPAWANGVMDVEEDMARRIDEQKQRSVDAVLVFGTRS